MNLEGKLIRPSGAKNKYWMAEIKSIELVTQGRNATEAVQMMLDALLSLVNRKGFKVFITDKDKDSFEIGSNSIADMIHLVLSRARYNSGKTFREAAKSLGSTSPNAFSRYETGSTMPKIDMFEQLLHAVDPELEVVVRRRSDRA